MSQGKFSNPRPHREEEREIEKAYRDLTRKKPHKPVEHKVTQEDILLAAQPLPTELPREEIGTSQVELPQTTPEAEDRQIEEAFRQVTGRPIPEKPAPQPAEKKPAPRWDPNPLPDEEELPDEPEEEAPARRPQPQWLTEVLEFYQQNTKLVLAALCALALAMIFFVITLFVRSAADPYGGKILNNVYIADVNVGGMTKKEAAAALNQVFGDLYAETDMVIDLSGTQLKLTPKDSGVSLDAAGAVEEAYAYGRTGTQAERDSAYKASKKEPYHIAILPYLNLKTENIRKFLTEKSENSGSTLVQTSYGLEGAEPELSTDKFDKSFPCQTLVITMGKPGVGFDPNTVYNQVLDAYCQRSFLVTVEDVQTLKDPDPIDLKRIYKEYLVEPVNAAIDPATGKTTPGSYGYDFDLESAQKLVDEARFGEEIRIPMRYLEPDIAGADAFFRDTLGEYQTRCTGDDDRTANLRIACQSIDGRILNPGESLSFRNAVGQLQSSQGYRSASEDTGMEKTVGGGVSQVSSTLYCAALLSDVTVSARTNLDRMPSFIGNGLDAGLDLKLKNELDYPIQIHAQVTGGYVRISISGTEQRDYYRMLGAEIVETIKPQTVYVEYPDQNAEGLLDGDVIQEGREGYKVKTYATRYDRTTDRKISSDYVATSNYPAEKRMIAMVEVEAETAPPTEPTTKPTQPPTEPTETETLPTETETLPTETETLPTEPLTEPTIPTAEEDVEPLDNTPLVEYEEDAA